MWRFSAGYSAIPPRTCRSLKICLDAIDVGSLLASCRTRLHYRVVNTDGLAFGIQLAKGALEFCCAERRSDLFQPRCGIRKMFFDGISQCPRPPQKHPAVPEVIPCFEEFGSAAGIGLFCESADTHALPPA